MTGGLRPEAWAVVIGGAWFFVMCFLGLGTLWLIAAGKALDAGRDPFVARRSRRGGGWGEAFVRVFLWIF